MEISMAQGRLQNKRPDTTWIEKSLMFLLEPIRDSQIKKNDALIALRMDGLNIVFGRKAIQNDGDHDDDDDAEKLPD